MKQVGITIRVATVCTFLSVLALISGCKDKGGPGESVEDAQLGKLAKAWTASSVTLDGVAQSDYANFVLTISGTPGNTTFTYSCAGRPSTSPWPSNGNWSFGATPETQIVRDPGTSDELALTYSVSDSQLQLTFAFSGTGYPGRTSNVNGQWVFTFTP